MVSRIHSLLYHGPCVMRSRITVSRIMISRMKGGFTTHPQVKSNALMCHRWQLATSIVYCIMVSCVMGSRITVFRIMISRMRGDFTTHPQVKSTPLMRHRWQLATMNLDLHNSISSCNFCMYAANHADFLPALYLSGCRRLKNIWIAVFIVCLTTLLSMSLNLRFWRSGLTTHPQVKSIAI